MALEEAGQATDPDPQASFGQTVAQLMQEQLGLYFVGLPDQISLRLDGVRALIAAYRLGLRPALLHEGPVPAHGAGWADLEAPCRFPARGPSFDCGHDAVAQINGQGSRHRLSSSESRSSNHTAVQAETPDDSI
ncbi:hypothetical protein ACUXK4_003389 [Methylorubrum extorquens]